MIALYAEEKEGQWKRPQCKNGKRKTIICSLFDIRISPKNNKISSRHQKNFSNEKESESLKSAAGKAVKTPSLNCLRII